MNPHSFFAGTAPNMDGSAQVPSPGVQINPSFLGQELSADRVDEPLESEPFPQWMRPYSSPHTESISPSTFPAAFTNFHITPPELDMSDPPSVEPAATLNVSGGLAPAQSGSIYQYPRSSLLSSGAHPSLSDVVSYQFGQVTPPDEMSPEGDDSAQVLKPEDSEEDNSEMEGAEVVQQRQSRVGRKKRKSLSEFTSGTVPKKTRLDQETEALPSAESQEEDGKREKFLKRNRLAASKCRQKKKEYINGLEERARDLTAARTHLQAYVAALKEEVLMLKSDMLKHSDCDCNNIREYLRREAVLLSEASARRGSYLFDSRPRRPSTSTDTSKAASSRRDSMDSVEAGAT